MKKSNNNKKLNSRQVLISIVDLQRKGKFIESLPYCEKLNASGFLSAEFLKYYAMALWRVGKARHAEQKLRKAILLDPKNFELLNMLGNLLVHLKEYNEAENIFNQAINVDPNQFEACNNLAIVLRRLGKKAESAKASGRAHDIDPTRYEPLYNMAMLWKGSNDKLADSYIDKAIELQNNPNLPTRLTKLELSSRMQNWPNFLKAYDSINSSELTENLQLELDLKWVEYLEATHRYEEAVTMAESRVSSNFGHRFKAKIGLIYCKMGHRHEGVEIIERVLDEHPSEIVLRWNLSLQQLEIGDIKNGFDNYEIRWKWEDFPSDRRVFNIPRWHGESLLGKELLVWGEQGLGDEVRFSSLIPELQTTGVSLTIECMSKLVPLFRHAFPWAQVLERGPLDCTESQEYLKYDFQIPMGSLTSILRKDLKSFYDKQLPWIPRLGLKEENIRSRLGVKPHEVLVGVCWRSSMRSATRDLHYFDVKDLAGLQAINNAVFVAVQYDECLDELNEVRSMGLPVFHYLNIDQKNNMMDVVALLGSCDLILCPTVSVGDIACGLGVPVIFLGPEYAQTKFGTSEVPWYPTASWYIKPEGSAKQTIEDIVADWGGLIEWANAVTTSGRTIRA